MGSKHMALAKEFTNRAYEGMDLAIDVEHRSDVYVLYLEYTQKNLEKALAKINTELEMTRGEIEQGVI